MKLVKRKVFYLIRMHRFQIEDKGWTQGQIFCKKSPVLAPICYGCHKLSAFFLISFLKLTNYKLLYNYCKKIVRVSSRFAQNAKIRGTWEIKRLARSNFCKNFLVLTPTFYGYHKLWPFFISFPKLKKITNFRLPF